MRLRVVRVHFAPPATPTMNALDADDADVLATVLRRAVLRAPRPADEAARFRGVTILPARGGEALVASVA